MTSHFKPLESEQDAMKTSSMFEDLLALPFEVAILGLIDLNEQELSSTLTRLQDLMGLLDTSDAACQSKEIKH